LRRRGPPPTTTTFGFACANAGMGNVEAASAPMTPMNCPSVRFHHRPPLMNVAACQFADFGFQFFGFTLPK
jgi:hypothetical protein